jgi:hypothetical protein
MVQIRFVRDYGFKRALTAPPSLVTFRWFVEKRPFPPIHEFREQHEIRFARIDPRRRPGTCRRPGALEQKCFLRTFGRREISTHPQHAAADVWRTPGPEPSGIPSLGTIPGRCGPRMSTW